MRRGIGVTPGWVVGIAAVAAVAVTVGAATLGAGATVPAAIAGAAGTSMQDRPADPPAEVASSSNPNPRFEGGVFRIGPFLRERLIGRNWHPGCPVGIDDLRHVRVSHWSLRGTVRSGPLILHESVARDVLWVFRRLFEARFPIHRIALPPRYRPPTRLDWFSTHDRSSSFNCRPATGNPGSLSHHSYGWAIDINPLENPYVRSDGSVLRRAAKPYTDRSRREPGMIHPGDVVVRSFARIGWEWGGDWVTLKDYMHFSLTGR
ncbi:MAG TPA: M15 family metallopeptidase [Actinomycetota bacterium]|jgi:hypothetical protein|nr:M15 family metallopeptidase [Actinomycetota bacterium]